MRLGEVLISAPILIIMIDLSFSQFESHFLKHPICGALKAIFK